jgi:putative spermidine/putrescine transport system substrate-binding protein
MTSRTVDRRNFLKYAGGGIVTVAAGYGLFQLFTGGDGEGKIGGRLSFADIGVGDPGSWSSFKEATGWDVNVVSIGNAPSAIINVLTAGGGQEVYDVVNIVGGMQKPLVGGDLIIPPDTSRIPNWGKNDYITRYISEGQPGFDFIGWQGKVYGVPTVLQGDSFAYLPEQTGTLNSYGALFDPQWKGFVALEDNYTTTGQKTALYLKEAGLADITDPANMTPKEIETVIDFLTERKKEGQFRVIWSSFEQAVNLLINKEVYVMDAWEPMVFAARAEGVKAEYAVPKEGYLLWAMGAYIVNDSNRPEERVQAVYDLLNFMLGGWYGAKITLLRGYMTNSQAIEYAKQHPNEFSAQSAKKVEKIHQGVKQKFELGGTWQNRWPTNVEAYEDQWARFKAAPGG